MRMRNVVYIIILILQTSNKDIFETRVANHMGRGRGYGTKEPGKPGMGTSEPCESLRETGASIGTMEPI